MNYKVEDYSNYEKQSAIEKTIQWAFLSSCGMTPGRVVESLSKETRDVLKTCKSEDWNHRVDDYTKH